MNQVRPSSILLLVGGIVLAVSSFLDWQAVEAGPGVVVTNTAWDFGMLGLFQTIIGVYVAVVGLLGVLGKADTLSQPAAFGMSMHQLAGSLAMAATLWGFALNFEDGARVGALFTWVAGAVSLLGAVIGSLGMDRISE